MQNHTDEAGVFQMNEIIKGDYIVRAVLKEYVFTPNQRKIVVKEGESEQFTFVGEKVAFSIYGKVQNLDGREISKVRIDASPDIEKNRNLKDVKSLPTEMAVTDDNGNFRIRGLNPNLYYNLQVRQSNTIKYIRPETYQVYMQEEDQHDVQFIGFEKDSSYKLSGRVLFSEELTNSEVDGIKNIQIDLVDSTNDHIIATEYVGMFRYYSFQGIKPGRYTIRMRYESMPQIWVQQEEVSVTLSDKDVNWNMRKNVKVYPQGGSNKKEMVGNILFGPLLLCVLLFAVVNDKFGSNQYLRSLLGKLGVTGN